MRADDRICAATRGGTNLHGSQVPATVGATTRLLSRCGRGARPAASRAPHAEATASHPNDTPQSRLRKRTASAGSKRNQNLKVGNGHRCPNKGEMHFNLEAHVGAQQYPFMSVFQIACITRPLMSVD